MRLGDVMAKLLSGRNVDSLKPVSQFLGIRLPLSPQLKRDLQFAVQNASVVGLSHFTGSMNHLKEYIERSGWKPHRIADSFINDQLYERGYLHRLLRTHRVALVGRAAPAAAAQLRKQGYHVAFTIALNNYDELSGALRKLRSNRKRFDLVFVGASVPGRILCSKIKNELDASAIEIGHMMDAMSHPRSWAKPNNRQRFKHYWMRKLKKKRSSTTASSWRGPSNPDRT
ncbi:GT-D fold domain-containing glycosyltransferase [Paenibacillus thailandensis]|uniref:GT-D fold domain-containing protein n=1 Tax=Paenibacillus thailandensis TaxID=393250 RepID=UPI003642536A